MTPLGVSRLKECDGADELMKKKINKQTKQ